LQDKILPQGILLFVFIPIVLFLFLQHPFGVPLSVLLGVTIMIAHRLIARPFFLRNATRRCFWCARNSNPRTQIEVNGAFIVENCNPFCADSAMRFFDFCDGYKLLIRIGIFLPLLTYIILLLLTHYGLVNFSPDWNKFIFRFFIAATVVTISFAYGKGRANQKSNFPFPIHNLFLIGAKNTLLVFRYVGIWWILASLYFLITSLNL
jgi:hypothetical protein